MVPEKLYTAIRITKSFTSKYRHLQSILLMFDANIWRDKLIGENTVLIRMIYSWEIFMLYISSLDVNISFNTIGLVVDGKIRTCKYKTMLIVEYFASVAIVFGAVVGIVCSANLMDTFSSYCAIGMFILNIVGFYLVLKENSCI